MKFGVIVCARLASRRLPRKALLPIMGIPCLSLVLRRMKTARFAHDLILATTTNEEDDALAKLGRREGVKVFRGSQDDVLGRFVRAFDLGQFDCAVRVTADCPFVSGATLDPVLKQCMRVGTFDLVTTKPAYPHGIDYEVIPVSLAREIDSRSDLVPEEREHIFNFIYHRESNYRVARLQPPAEFATDAPVFLLDTVEDYERMTRLLFSTNDPHISPALLRDQNCHAA